MTMFDASWSPKLRKIGELERGDHYHLTDGDDCYFLGEYTARAGYQHSSTNQIIANIKKKPSVRLTPQWQYKTRDMARVASALGAALNQNVLPSITFVPIPPSKHRTDPEYDDRMTVIAKGIRSGVDVREMISSCATRKALHESDTRLRPEELEELLELNEAVCAPPPSRIVLLDDVITTGSSFKACSNILRRKFPEVSIAGVFVARRIFDYSGDFEVVDVSDF